MRMKVYTRFILVEVSVHAKSVEDAQVCYNEMESKIKDVTILSSTVGGRNGLVPDMTKVPVRILETILKATAHRLPEPLQIWIKRKTL